MWFGRMSWRSCRPRSWLRLFARSTQPLTKPKPLKQRVEAVAMARAKVVRLPALQLVAVDSTDPVSKGEDTVYTVRVLNEGNAPGFEFGVGR